VSPPDASRREAGAGRAVAWRHGYHAAVCGRVEPWAHGTVVRADDVPTYYEYNLARVEGGRDLISGLDAEALAAAAEPALADLGHRRIEVEDTADGARLAPGFAAFSAHGDTAEVEQVFCRPERRNGGLGGALVCRALEEAHAGGARHALIEADDTGDAKRLYERLGFRTVWVRHVFTRR
jgi:GNAT superfamily N-acetyltransferase